MTCLWLPQKKELHYCKWWSNIPFAQTDGKDQEMCLLLMGYAKVDWIPEDVKKYYENQGE